MVTQFITEVKDFFVAYEAYLQDTNAKLKHAVAATRDLSIELNLICLDNVQNTLVKIDALLNKELTDEKNILPALNKVHHYLNRAQEVLLLEQNTVVIADDYIRPRGTPIHAHKKNREAVDGLVENINALLKNPIFQQYEKNLTGIEKTWLTLQTQSALSYRLLDIVKYLFSRPDSSELNNKAQEITEKEVEKLSSIQLHNHDNLNATKTSKNKPLALAFDNFVLQSMTLQASAKQHNVQADALKEVLATVNLSALNRTFS